MEENNDLLLQDFVVDTLENRSLLMSLCYYKRFRVIQIIIKLLGRNDFEDSPQSLLYIVFKVLEVKSMQGVKRRIINDDLYE